MIPQETVEVFDHLLAVLENGPESSGADLAHEHVLGARSALLGSMPAEYKFELEQAEDAIRRIEDRATRFEAMHLLDSIRRNTRIPEPTASGN